MMGVGAQLRSFVVFLHLRIKWKKLLKILEKLNQQKGSVVQRKNTIVQIFEDLLTRYYLLIVKIFVSEIDLIRVMTVYREKYKLSLLFVFCFTGDVMLTRIHHHVTGILSHGQGKAFKFTWTNKFPCDTNITMNCLLKVFEDLS